MEIRSFELTRAALFSVLVVFLLNTAESQTDPTDAQAMRDLAAAIDPAGLIGWDTSEDPCGWNFVSCGADGKVMALRLAGKSLTGTLPGLIRNLTALTTLELQRNAITGPLPSFAGMSSLQIAILHNNSFSSIPPDFFVGLTSLRGVNLDHNPFEAWSIPASLKDASSLVNFSANAANVTGEIPTFLGSEFPSLISVCLAYNSLSGVIPTSFADTLLQVVWLNNQQGTKLSGRIDVLSNMYQLVQVWLQSNAFTGPVPDLSNLKSLSELNLRDNALTGPIPSSLSLLPALKIVVITNNFLQGSFPEFPKGVTVDNLPDSNRFCLSSPGDCDSRVVNLLSIAKAIGYPSDLADSWKGNDPCKGWVAISCDPKGNITVINFENRGFSGTISPEFVKLSSLQKLLLSRNNLTGPIPPEITTLPSLAVLDVSNNLLSGKMPVFGENVVVITNGNPDLGKDIEQGSPSPERSNPNTSGLNAPSGSGFGGNGKKSTVSAGVVLGSVLAGVCGVCLLGLIGLLVYSKKTKGLRGTQGSNTVVIHPRLSGSDPDLLKITVAGSSVGNAVPSELTSQGSSGRGDIQVVEAGNMVISIQVLRNVTNNFSEKNILGQGGFGTVYKGELHDGTNIAVKRMEAGVIGGKALNEFTSEITVLTKVRHRHLVALLGYCLDGNEKLLVYEYMPQGALSRHLFSWKEEGAKPLDWKKRLTIALDVARGVEYLHNLAHQSFIHRDLKPSNILLGDDMRAKVADFGLVRLAPEGKCSVETRLAGTFGYLAPEYAVTGRLTIKADVFSFGVILMELISGRRALDETQPEESLHLVTWFRRMHLNKDTFRGAIDPSLELTEETLSSILRVAELAGHCCAREPYQRPDMSHAVSVLSPLVEQWKPTDPDEDDCYGIDLDMTLPQALKKWQAFEDTHVGVNSHSMASLDNTQTSIPTRPSGFADSFTSADAR